MLLFRTTENQVPVRVFKHKDMRHNVNLLLAVVSSMEMEEVVAKKKLMAFQYKLLITYT